MSMRIEFMILKSWCITRTAKIRGQWYVSICWLREIRSRVFVAQHCQFVTSINHSLYTQVTKSIVFSVMGCPFEWTLLMCTFTTNESYEGPFERAALLIWNDNVQHAHEMRWTTFELLNDKLVLNKLVLMGCLLHY